MLKDWLELPHVDKDGYKTAAELNYSLLNDNLERVPVRFTIELEWMKDEEYEPGSYYDVRLITPGGDVIPFEFDEEDEDVDFEGGKYVIKSIYLPELNDEGTNSDTESVGLDFYLELSVDHSKNKVIVLPRLYQLIAYRYLP
jgi:hypothetical protein